MSLPIHAEALRTAMELTEVERRNQSFWNLLQHTFGKLGVARRTGTTRILNLACGICEEARVLCSFFSTGIYGMPGANAELTAIDSDELAIHRARLLARQPGINENQAYLIAANCHFLAGDVTRLQDIPQVPAQADIVVLRHQFLLADELENRDGWRRIIAQAVERLAEGGYLFITSFTEHERLLLESILSTMNVEVMISEKSPFALPYPGRTGVAFDHSVTLAKRK